MSIIQLNNHTRDQEPTEPTVPETKSSIVEVGEKETPTEQTNEPTEEQKQAERNKRVVVLDGPLSRIYTKALNLVYAKEDMAAMLQPELPSDVEVASNNAMYVYAVNGSEMKLQEVSTVTKEISHATKGHAYESKVVVLEGINKYSGELSECLEGMGVETIVIPEAKSLGYMTKTRKLSLESESVTRVTNETWGRLNAHREA